MTQAASLMDRKEQAEERTTDERQLVLFQLAGANYGVDIYSVQRLIQVPDITKVPKAPAYVEGVIDVRGDIIPVINLIKRFGIEGGGVRENGRIVITEIGDQIVGFLVDAVSEVTRLSEQDIEPPSSVVGGHDIEFISGIGKQRKDNANRLIIVLDVAMVLNQEEQTAIAEFANGTERTASEPQDRTPTADPVPPAQALEDEAEEAGTALE